MRAQLEKVLILRVPETNGWKCVAYYNINTKTHYIHRYFPSKKRCKRWAREVPTDRLPNGCGWHEYPR